MKVLITGAGGFIGSHLTESCVAQGHEVRAFVRYNSQGDWGWLEHSPVREKVEVVAGDIRDYDFVFGATKSMDAVLHLAALIGIPYSYISPLAYIKTNVEGTYNILESARRHGIGKVLVTSTSETYGTAQYVPINESHPVNGQSPYSASKIAADQLALSYHLSFGLPVKIVRPFNTYGPRQSARAVIPTIISQILAGNKKINLGNLSPTRDLTYVKDTVAGFLEVLNCDGLFGEVFNIGMNDEISVGELAKLITEIMGAKVELQEDDQRVRPDKSEVMRLRCDNSKILSKTKWRPKYDLRKGLAETIEWMKNNMGLYKAGIYNV